MDIEKYAKKGLLWFVLAYIAFYMAKLLFENFGWITVIGYIFALINGISKIDEDPHRIIKWGVGFFGCAYLPKFVFDTYIKNFNYNGIISIISIGVVIYVLVALYLKYYYLRKS